LPVDPFPKYSGPVSIIVRPITTKTQHGIGPEQGAQCALLLFSVTHGCLPAYAVNTLRNTTRSFFLLPRPPIFPPDVFHPAMSVSRHSVRGINAFLLVANLGFRFISAMNFCIYADSKLCACDTRHASGNFLSEIPAAQPGKGQGFAPPRCIPSRVPQAALETVPVSTPFGFVRVIGFRSWEAHP
jgi:hypothetical protein